MLHRNRAVIAVALIAALTVSGPVAAAAAVKFVLGGFNQASSTTTIQMAATGPVLSLQNANAGAGSSSGLNVTVPGGQPPIIVSSGAGTATNLDADKLDGHDASDFVQGSVDTWHEIGTSGEPAWGRITLTSVEPFLPTAFMKDPFGFVHLQGHVVAALDQPEGCDAYAMFTLPVGYRPAAQVTEAAIAHDAAIFQNVVAQVDIFATGAVEICLPRLTQYSWVALDGITFRTAP